ncbi:hypothetical protein DPMN_181015 [Dreissena polymorpha]|uniref:Uncharacterized protein n=1 Tax=Dreissena polymorpha TaxID=45954 RepID=A0A9D4I168_DREPO|nr:hypothetical protein DPMN_181015 [Dreissena polymorpha]
MEYIHKTNVLTKFHDHWTNKCDFWRKTAPPPGGHVFQMFTTIFKLVRDIHITNAKNVTSKEKDHPPGGHEDWTKNVTSRLFTCFHYTCIHIEKTAPSPGGHFHDDWAKIVTSRVFTRNTAPPPGGHVFQETGTIFELNQHIIKTNILTKLHEDWVSNVTYTVFTSFELSRGTIGTNVLTKFHTDRTRNVASRVFTRQNVDDRRTMDDGQKAIPKCDGQTDRQRQTERKP